MILFYKLQQVKDEKLHRKGNQREKGSALTKDKHAISQSNANELWWRALGSMPRPNRNDVVPKRLVPHRV